MIHLVGDVSVFVAALAAGLFCVGYHVTAPWRRSMEGRFLMSFIGLHAVVFAWIAYRISVTTPRQIGVWEDLLRTVIFGGCAAFLVWAVVLLWHRQIWPGLRSKREEASNGA